MWAVGGFDWDKGNRSKCLDHGVSIAEIEGAFMGALAVHPDPAHSGEETRFKAIAQTGAGRSMLIVFTLRTRRGQTLIRPISARFMHAREVAHYETETARTKDR